MDVVPMWTKIWDLPKELRGDDDGISFAASMVGDPYAMDENTVRRHHLDYARVCVFNMAGPELQTIILVDVDRHTQFKVEYQWVPTACKHCRVFGHSTKACKERPTRTNRHIANRTAWVPRVATAREYSKME